MAAGLGIAEGLGREAWDRIRTRLRAEYGEDVYSSWFARVDLEGQEGGTVHVSVPTRFLKQWIQAHYRDRLVALCRAECEAVQGLEIAVRGAARPRVGPAPAATLETVADTVLPPSEPPPGLAPASDAPARDTALGSPLDPRLTFGSFVEGRSNALALAAARQVAEARPGEPVRYNPLYLHAAVGLGKTHLLQAIAHAARAASPGRRVLYLTAEQFMWRFVAALKAQSAIVFKDTLRGIDLLLIDDLQFLQGVKVQEEFCHTLNSLIDGARQVVVAGDRPPGDLEALDERVRSRLAGGLLVDIAPPDQDLRRRILVQRIDAARRLFPDLVIDERVIDYVAQSLGANCRDLDGAVNRLFAYGQLTRAPLTVEVAENAIKDLVRPREPRRVRIEDIQRVVSREYNVPRADLVSSRRTRTVVLPRQIAMYLAKAMTPRSLPEIGRRFGGRDHTTVLHAVRKIEDKVTQDRGFAAEIDRLKTLLDQE